MASLAQVGAPARCISSWNTRSSGRMGPSLNSVVLPLHQGARALHQNKMRLPMPVRSMAKPEPMTEELIRSKNEHNPVVIYSKTWCPYCTRVKGLFKKLKVKVVVVELNELVDETDVQAALKRMTGQSSVPNVFIGGKHIGGCDDTYELHEQGKLMALLESARANIQS